MEYKIKLTPCGEKTFSTIEEARLEGDRIFRKIESQTFTAPCDEIRPSMLKMHYDIYNENDVMIEEGLGCWMFFDTYIDMFRNYLSKNDLEALKAMMPKSNKPSKVENAILFVIAGAIAIWGVLSLKSCQTEHEEEAFIHQLSEDTHTDKNVHATVTSTAMSGDYEGVDEWTNHDGDIKACRKDLLHRLEVIYGDEEYDRSPDRIEATIVGDTLRLVALSFKDYGYRTVMMHDMWQMFKDCGFANVWAMEGDWGGAGYYNYDMRTAKQPHIPDFDNSDNNK